MGVEREWLTFLSFRDWICSRSFRAGPYVRYRLIGKNPADVVVENYGEVILLTASMDHHAFYCIVASHVDPKHVADVVSYMARSKATSAISRWRNRRILRTLGKSWEESQVGGWAEGAEGFVGAVYRARRRLFETNFACIGEWREEYADEYDDIIRLVVTSIVIYEDREQRIADAVEDVLDSYSLVRSPEGDRYVVGVIEEVDDILSDARRLNCQ